MFLFRKLYIYLHLILWYVGGGVENFYEIKPLSAVHKNETHLTNFIY